MGVVALDLSEGVLGNGKTAQEFRIVLEASERLVTINIVRLMMCVPVCFERRSIL